MAKAAVKASAPTEPETPPHVPAPITPIGPPAELQEMMKEDKGKGVSTATSDNLVPLVYVLQSNSPQVARRNPAYIDGAEPGAFWLRNAQRPIVPGEIGLLVQSCYFFKDWVEWRPRDSGGGFIARHPEVKENVCPVADAVLREDPDHQNRVRYIRPNGNEVIHTRNHVVRVFTEEGVLAYIIPFTSTGHTTSRSWMQLMNSICGQVGFAGKFRLVTRERTNPLGTWFGVDVKFESWCSTDEYKAGKALYEAFQAGEKQAEAPESATQSGLDEEIPF